MQSTTRAALKLAPGATDADAAAALDKGGHRLTLRDLEKTDSNLVLYLRREQPETYSRLHEAEYGKKPKAQKLATPMEKAKASQPTGADKSRMEKAKVKLAALGADVTLRDLEMSDSALVLELKHHAPDEYQRLFAATYGVYDSRIAAPVGSVVNLATPTPTPTPAVTTYHDKRPMNIHMVGELGEDVLNQLPKLGELATNPRFERLD